MTPSICFLLSSCFDYESLICGDAGPAVADEYGWRLVRTIGSEVNHFDVVIVDNRHHDASELRLLRELIRQSVHQIFILRVVDPFLHHRSDPWYQFCHECLDEPNCHYLTPYTLTGITALWQSVRPCKQFIIAPYTYDSKQELDLAHDRRIRGMIISGANSRNLYPIRYQAQRIASVLPSAISGLSLLKHPGYSDIGQSRGHNVTGDSFTQLLSNYTAAFGCSTSYRIELMKYREIAYAGCIPVGDLPYSLVECPPVAALPWRRNWLALTHLIRRFSAGESEAMARSYRQFFRMHREQLLLRERVNTQIRELAGYR